MINIRHATLLLSVLLGGCMSHAGQPFAANKGNVELRNQAGKVNNSSVISVEDVGQVRVGRSYIAASGRMCRQLNTLSGELLPLRSCKNKSGQWVTTRTLSSAIPLQKRSAPAVVQTANKTMSMAVEQGETLWSFAKRVTGNPLNWKAIASYNNITDEDIISSGQRLQVEVSLVKGIR